MKRSEIECFGHLITIRRAYRGWAAGSSARARVAALTSLSFLLTDGQGCDQPRCEIGIYLTDDSELKRLNRRYRGRDHPTNILSFPMIDIHGVRSLQIPEPIPLGDLALAGPIIAREAQAQDKSFLDHLTHLVVHGVLHLLGHHHDSPIPARKMEALEVQILKALNVAEPYGMGGGR